MRQTEIDALALCAWGMEHWDGVSTGRSFRLRVALRLKAAGLIESFMAEACDGDGFILEGHRPRPAWRLTDAGYAEHRKHIEVITAHRKRRIESALRARRSKDGKREKRVGQAS